ncbi:MAG: hypothetical protein NUV65_05490 [Candidatus Roizmanbacteria bacterium]|nr:hypothetical protein [Candidatus Roizmanbacteria bacterium]
MNTETHILTILRDPNTNPLRRAALISKLVEDHHYSKIELANILKKSPSYISNHLRLLRLPDAVKDALISAIISEGHGRALSCLNTESEILNMFEEIIRFNLSVRQVESKVDSLRSEKREYGKLNEDINNQARDISRATGASTSIRRRSSQLVLTINFPYSIVGFNKIKRISEILKRG